MEIPSGETVPTDLLRDHPSSRSGTSTARSAPVLTSVVDDNPIAGTVSTKVTASLASDVERCSAEFDLSIEQRDAAGAVAAILDLDDAIRDWSADTLQSAEMDKARALLRSMIIRLGDASRSGLTDPRDVLGPLVEIALSARSEVRRAKLYDLSDQIRDELALAGVEVRDTADGQMCELTKPD